MLAESVFSHILNCLCSFLLQSWGLGWLFVWLGFLVSARNAQSLILVRPSRHSYINECPLPTLKNILLCLNKGLEFTHPPLSHGTSQVTLIMIKTPCMEEAGTLLTDFPFRLAIIPLSPRQFSLSQERLRFCHLDMPVGLDAACFDPKGKAITCVLEVQRFGKPPNINQWIQIEIICFLNS